MNQLNKLKEMKRSFLLAALLLGATLCAQAQTQTSNGYIIYNSTYGYLTHNASTGAVSTAMVADFDPSTCLWTISGNYIRPVSSNGSAVLGNLYLRPRSNNNTYSLNTNTSTNYATWSGGLSEDGNPVYNSRYLRYSGSSNTWQVSTNNSSHGTIYAVTKTTTAGTQAATYNGTLSGTTAFFTAGATATYTPAVTFTAAYDYTTVSYSYSGGTLASETTGTVPTPSDVNLSDGWTIEWSLSDDTYASISSAGVLTVSSTLPATYATATVSYTATDGVNTVTASLPITIAASESVYEGVIGGTEGVSGGIVTLNDYEDHTWSYYSDASLPAQMRSLNPANVKITYYGNGTNTVSTSTDENPAANTFTASTNSSVKVGIDEPEGTFVYYKTLERTDGSTSANPTGRCLYRTILNPFSVRPTYGSGDTRWRGFYKWRVKSFSGGSIYTVATGGTALTVGSTIDAETDIYFAPTSEYGMAVELEALWAGAAVSTSSAPSTYSSAERNFYVRRSNASSNVFSSSSPCTYSSFYPNGTTDGTTAATMNDRVTVQSGTAKADSRVEYHIWSNTTALTVGDSKLNKVMIGRGMTSNSNPQLNFLVGTFTSSGNVRACIESGTYGGSGSTVSYLYGEKPTMNDNLVHMDVILGSDYDRAKGDDTKLALDAYRISHDKDNGMTTGSAWKDFHNTDIVVKSGKMQERYWTSESAYYLHSFYCRSTLTGTTDKYPGIAYLTVEGGQFASINGGRGNYNAGLVTNSNIVFSLRMKGGTVHGSIYGGASSQPSYGCRRMVVTGGTVEGWIAGGSNGPYYSGSGHAGGATYGNSYIYVGGNAFIGTEETSSRTLDLTPGGNIFGAGRGSEGQVHTNDESHPASIVNSYIAVADNASVLRNVYGGGFYGHTGFSSTSSPFDSETSANLFIVGGTVHGSVFGGGNNSQGTNANIRMTGGLVEGGIYGGSNLTGEMHYNTTLQINGGQVGVDADHLGNIHGGGYGANTSVSGNVSVTLGDTPATSGGATVYGNVYGGSALGDVNSGSSNTTTVTLNRGTVNGNLFGGALGEGADVNGKITVTMTGGTVSDGLYGGGDAAAYSPNSNHPLVNMTGGTAGNVFGGGKGASAIVTGNPQITLSGTAHVTGNVYGGGNAATVNGNTDVKILE